MAQAELKINTGAAIPSVPALSAALLGAAQICANIARTVASSLISMTSKTPPLTDAQVGALKEKLTTPEAPALAPALAAAWLCNQWLWLGAALLYAAPFSWLSVGWTIRTGYLVLQPADTSLPSWCAAIAPPAMETAALGALAAGGWRIVEDQVKKAGELQISPSRAPGCWWGMPVAIVLFTPQTILGSTTALVAGVVVACAMEMASQILAAQLVRKVPATTQ